jgi:RHS repeat-associated protein
VAQARKPISQRGLSTQKLRLAEGHWYIDEPLLYTVNGANYYVHQNHLFSVSAVTDAAGNVKERYSYSSYGDRAVRTAAGAPLGKSQVNNGIGFTGYVINAETNQYHARARQFDVTLGRFTARDPALYIDGYSLYRAFFIPNRLDPSGKLCEDECATVGAKSDFVIDDLDVARAVGSPIPPGQVHAEGEDLLGAIDKFNRVQNLGNIAGGAAQGLGDAFTSAVDAGADAFSGGEENLGAGGSPTDGVIDRMDSIVNSVAPGQAMIIWVHVKWKVCTSSWCCWPFSKHLTNDDAPGDWYRYPEHGTDGVINTPGGNGEHYKQAAASALQRAMAAP